MSGFEGSDSDQGHAYRRGFTHGVRAALNTLGRFLSEADQQSLDVWFANKLSVWSRDGAEDEPVPPEFPKLS